MDVMMAAMDQHYENAENERDALYKQVDDLSLEVKLLRRALRTYGHRQRMSMAADPAVQQAIDRAMAENE